MIGMAAALLGAVPAQAIAPRSSLAGLYVRARAAQVAGDTSAANAGFAALMAADPTNMVVADRAYRQAVTAGDMPVALKAARVLDARKMLPSDGYALLALEQVRTRNWTRAGEATERLAKDRLFGFLAPYFRAWIAVESRKGDPLALAQAAQGASVGGNYYAEQRALLLIATGRAEQARAERGAEISGQLPSMVKGADEGLAVLFAHFSSDLSRQQLSPLGLIMGRMASYAAPNFSPAWLLLAEQLRTMHRPDLALAALDHVPANDPLAGNAQAMRIGLLDDSGKRDAALAEALAAARRTGAKPQDWARVGDLYLAMERPADAVNAYANAVAAADAAKLAPDLMWPLLLQQAAALNEAGNWPAAKAALDRAYAIAPGEAVVLNQVGYSYIERHEDIDRAAAMIEQASKLQPDDAAITDSLGWVLFLRGKSVQAVPLLERAAASSPGEPTINEHLGDVYWSLGRQFEARYAWRAALITAEDKDRARISSKIDVGLSGATAAP
ncbi:tetratricopeptide repeat protein [Sphingomonas sp.]|uniref:tetratricopeptide repeat protein n=1 Tax=Sphingomonas sp. TaxID=28214 RepID=UPI003B3B9AE3